jgi:hypothetical protein
VGCEIAFGLDLATDPSDAIQVALGFQQRRAESVTALGCLMRRICRQLGVGVQSQSSLQLSVVFVCAVGNIDRSAGLDSLDCAAQLGYPDICSCGRSATRALCTMTCTLAHGSGCGLCRYGYRCWQRRTGRRRGRHGCRRGLTLCLGAPAWVRATIIRGSVPHGNAPLTPPMRTSSSPPHSDPAIPRHTPLALMRSSRRGRWRTRRCWRW